MRSQDEDMALMGGNDLVPGLLELLRATLLDDAEDETDE
jgi:hypothetical protein